jgi:hypothetical protein
LRENWSIAEVAEELYMKAREILDSLGDATEVV